MALSVVMTPVGSAGDVLPLVDLGARLRARGHRVKVVTAEPFRAATLRAGLEFVGFPDTETFERAVREPDLWHPTRGLGLVARFVGESLDGAWARLAEHVPDRDAVLVGHSIAFATRCYEERTGVPAITVHLAPSAMRSLHRQPAFLPGMTLSGLPMPVKRALWWMTDRWLLDPAMVPALDAFRARHGLAPVRRPFRAWLSSPNGVLGLFPDWFGPRQPDWPARLTLAGFPLADGGDGTLAPEVEGWLAAHPGAVVVAPGSANAHARAFFAAAIEGVRRLGRPVVAPTPYPEVLPAPLADDVLHARYIPFAPLLARAEAIVHHGGIGTAAQALAAGLPQLVVPMGFDQPDNATRLAELGVARWLRPARLAPDSVARTLGRLLDTPSVASACARWAPRLDRDGALERACDAVEAAARREPPPAPR